ncbi:MAG: PKD domain-containing protein [Candidatus Marinimicrobia bacterium]|nr:PKD domain-containing protein [Candidatus Neomarinimicrobiota bacterium]
MRKFKVLFCALMIVMFALQSCSLWEDLIGGGDDKKKDDGKIAIETETKKGNLVIGENANVNPGNLEVVSFTDRSDIENDGNFEVGGNLSDKFQVLIIKKPQNKLPIYIGIYDPVTDQVNANATTTAMALCLLNPYLVYTTQTQRQNYLNAVQVNDLFDDLVALLEEAYASDADNALNYEVNPRIYQLTVQIMKSTMENMAGAGKGAGAQSLEPPYIQDISGTDINFVNPRRIYYSAGIYTTAGALNDVLAIEKSSPITSFTWGWPPSFTSSATQTEYDLGNGTFDITITKGMNFSEVNNWDIPSGRATKLNSAQSILYFMDLLTGYDELRDAEDLQLSVQNDLAALMNRNMNERNTEEFIENFLTLMYNNSDKIAEWLLGSQIDAAEEFIESCTLVLKNAIFVFQLMGFVNENGPFYWELVESPGEILYRITQTNGNITEQEENNPPAAEFTIAPPAGIVGTVFNLDASLSVDDIDPQSSLMYRWDVESDGDWDNSWTTSSTATVTYNEAGSYLITLQVKDSAGLIGSITHRVNVGGGAGTATHVKIFQDGLPWSSNAMINMLQSLGFTEGPGSNQYEIIPSSEMVNVSLIPGTDLVIISNDQNDNFYANYAANQVRFTNFVYMGGSMFWEACDRGWAYGDLVAQGVVLPGNIVLNYNYDNYNYVTDQNLPLVTGLPNELDHNYASHESFTNLSDGTTVYCVDSQQRPTLIEFNLGGGWIIVTGQPLEHQYDNNYGNPDDMKQLLPRIVSYFTGKQFSKAIPAPMGKNSNRASGSSN